MKILIASGSFKDVYTSMQACEMIQSILREYNPEIAPLCDGGEYTFDTLKYYLPCKIETVEKILNPYQQKVSAEYLTIKDEAFIISSKILHLTEDEKQFKNPLHLTDCGLGELTLDAIKKGYKKINICLGGTSTVTGGIGFAQALGAKIYDRGNQPFTNPIKGKDSINVSKINFDKNIYKDIEVNIICDGIPSASKMDIITRLKIGDNFKENRETILKEINNGIKNIAEVTKSSTNKDFTGAAGGMRFGIECIFDANFLKGGDYFYKKFDIDKKIKNSDIIITGEGRFDNPKWEKTPVTIAQKAKEYKKKVIFLSGRHDKSMFQDNDYIITNNALTELGIDTLISCQKFYDENPTPQENLIEFYRQTTPKIFEQFLVKAIKI